MVSRLYFGELEKASLKGIEGLVWSYSACHGRVSFERLVTSSISTDTKLEADTAVTAYCTQYDTPYKL